MSAAAVKSFSHARGRQDQHLARRIALVAGLSLPFVLGCGRASPSTDKPTASAAAVDTASGSVLATIADDKVTLADARARAGETLEQLENQYRRARDKIIGSALDSIIAERLLTSEIKKRGKSADELINAEMATRPEPTESEIAAWYNGNPDRVRGRSLDQLRTDIGNVLRNERKHLAYDKLLTRLKRENKVTVSFEPWKPQFANKGAPALGKENAPVTLVEFSDFQCPYCQAAVPTLKQVTREFGEQVRIIYRQYPILSLHPFAFKAAEASLCANEQGKFWELHDAMFADQKKLAVRDLKLTARRLGLDGKKFDQCLDTGRYTEQVQDDMKEGQRIGVTGTPAMYINGVYVEGAVPFSTLDTLIKKELAKNKRGG